MVLFVVPVVVLFLVVLVVVVVAAAAQGFLVDRMLQQRLVVLAIRMCPFPLELLMASTVRA